MRKNAYFDILPLGRPPRLVVVALAFAFAACAGSSEDAGGEPSDAANGPSDATTDHSNPDPAKAPELQSVEAHQSGPAGRKLTITIEGADVNRDTVRMILTVFDASNAPVLAFFDSLASAPDSNQTFVPFPSGVRGRPQFTSTVALDKLMEEQPDIRSIAVILEDAAGNRSNEMSAEVSIQEVKSAGDECDPDYIASRCPAGMACKGDPAVCAEGDPPEVTDFAYYPDAVPSAIVIIGTDPEEDIASLHVEFFDDAGEPVHVALNSEETETTLDYDRDDIELHGYVGDGVFAVRMEPTGDFTTLVSEIAVTAQDAAGHKGERTTVKARKAKTAGNGSQCDPWGFVGCWEKSSCVPGLPGEDNRCESHISMKKDICDDAPVLDLSTGAVEVGGIAAGASAYEPPAMCQTTSVSRRPESVFRIVLEEPKTLLRVTTNLPGTNFDTIVYVAPECGLEIEEAMACGDDTTDTDGSIKGAGSFELTDVKAGEYVIVVDSWVEQGGAFTLRIETE